MLFIIESVDHTNGYDLCQDCIGECDKAKRKLKDPSSSRSSKKRRIVSVDDDEEMKV